MKSLNVHRVNFFEPEPQAIRCLASDAHSSRLAVSRADASIEIWDMKQNPYLEKVIPGASTASVESLAWCKGRLFSTGLHGYVTEYDLSTLLPKNQLIVTSGCPVWCMSFNKQQSHLAIGNEDGHVILFEISNEDLYFDKKFNRQEGCILCLDWHNNGKIIVTGSLDAIRIWNVETGHAVNRIMLARANKNTPTVVWCISVLEDMTIVSGDSCGKTSFWDGNSGTLISSAGSQKEDILALTVSKNEDVIYTSGVDPTITMYMKSQNGAWVPSIKRNIHSHDVRALKLVGDFLVSGGDDCNLVFSKYPPKTTVKFFPFCSKPYAITSTHPSCIMLRYPNCIEVWSIENNNQPTNLLRIKPKENERIVCCSMSSNGSWLAYSSQHQIRLFNVAIDTKKVVSPTLNKVTLPDEVNSAATVLTFTADSSKLLLYSENKISIVNCSAVQSILEATIETDSDHVGHLSLMEVSPDSLHLACGTHSGKVVLYDLHTFKISSKLPSYKCQPTCLKFDPSSENLIVSYCDRKIVEYSLEKEAYTTWSKQEILYELQSSSYHPINSICFCLNNLYLQDENAIYIFDRETQDMPERKKTKVSKDYSIVKSANSFQTVAKYEHISSMHSLVDDLVIVQINLNRILECLPPPVFKKKYGT
ncbi:hypothetical protein JTE90_012809 [Oedothorax gibbosus]|uniref:Anaphase-promoting complex subunit 4-like WD40 domain-containing protein n=1 Tax=Oedothorax gibbosus TaxID=931172 RepID=A0AAV6VYD2_9ARAC|nr:hypothetical protein JTE90_012809 [Oedothorax gibbosus]